MRYFGESWSELTECGEQIPTPVGEPCVHCKEEFVEGDKGVAIPHCSFEEAVLPGFGNYHKNCFLRTIVGSVGHQQKQCSCYGGALEDPPGLTPRQAADEAVRVFEAEGSRR